MSRAGQVGSSDLGTVTFLAHFELCRASERGSKPWRRPERSAMTCCDAGLLTRCSAHCRLT